MFKVYSAPSGAENISPMDKERMLFKQVLSMDEAISWAAHMSKSGHAVVLIEGDDGTQLGASEIASALRRHTG